MPHITTQQENISSHLVSILQRAPNHHGWSLWLTAKPAAPHRHSRWLTGLSQSQYRCCQCQPGMRVAHHLLAPHQLIFVENCRQALRRCAVAHYQTTSVLTLNEKEHRRSGVSFHSKETTTCHVDEPQLKKNHEPISGHSLPCRENYVSLTQVGVGHSAIARSLSGSVETPCPHYMA